MEARGTGPIEREPADQHDARLRAWPDNRADSAEATGKALAEEPRQQSPHQPVFEVDLHHVRRIDAALGIARGLESDSHQRCRSTPGLKSLLPTSAADAKIVQRFLPTTVSKHCCGGIKPEKLCAADLACARRIERAAGTTERRGDDCFQVRRFHADPFPGVFEQLAHAVELARLTLDTSLFLIIHLRLRLGDARVLLQSVDLVGHLRIAQTFAGKQIGELIRQHLSRGTQLPMDRLGLLDETLEHSVLGALAIYEIAAPHLRRWLQLTIDAAVALLKLCGIPGQVDVDQVMAARLEVDALARSIRADQDAQRIGGGISFETSLQLFAPVGRCRAGKAGDAVLRVEVMQRLQKPSFEPAARVLVFREEEQASVDPGV